MLFGKRVPTGAMGSYTTFFLAGLYPVPATRQYLLSSPFFPQVSFFNPVLNTTTTIKSKNFLGNPGKLTSFCSSCYLKPGNPYHRYNPHNRKSVFLLVKEARPP